MTDAVAHVGASIECEYRIPFNFWGVGVGLRGANARDEKHFRFIFREFLAPTSHNDLNFRIETDNEDLGFVEALRVPSITKTVWVEQADGTEELYDRFDSQSNKPGFLPPFRYPQLAARFTLLHAAALTKDDRTVMMTGGSGAGKTTLSLGLMERGWSLLSDDVAVCEGTDLIQGFPKPMNIRSKVLANFSSLKPLIEECGLPVETDSGLTFMTHAADVGLKAFSGLAGNISRIQLEKNTNASLSRMGHNDWTLNTNVERDLRLSLDLVESVAGRWRPE